MANAICVHTTLDSDTVRLAELLPFVGKKVQIIVVEDDSRERGAEKSVRKEAQPKRTLGSLRGLLAVPENFNDPLPEEFQRAFEGESVE